MLIGNTDKRSKLTINLYQDARNPIMSPMLKKI